MNRLSALPISSALAFLSAMAVPMTTGCGSDALASPHDGPSAQLTTRNHSPPPPPAPPRPQTKEACDQCNGLWGVHGFVPTESCICATSDAGQRCLDGNACIGQCLVDETLGFKAMDSATPPRGFYEGTCSAYDTTFGCHLVIPRDVEERLPLPSDEAAQRLCID